MSEWDSSKTEHENMVNKAADIRELIWDHFPDHQSEMIGCPYSVLCYTEKRLKQLESEKAALERGIREWQSIHKQCFDKLNIAVEALEFCQQMVKMRPELWESMIYEKNKAALARIEHGENKE